MSDPPSYLDLFKNDEVQKVWSCEEGIERVLVNSHGVLCSWPALMSDTWNANHVARDAEAHWSSCQADIDALHAHLADLSNEGQKVRLCRCKHFFIQNICRGISHHLWCESPRL